MNIHTEKNEKNPIELKNISPNDHDLESNWLYQMTLSKSGEPTVVPVRTEKTGKFRSRLVACRVEFANKSKHWALIQGLNLEVPEFSKHNRELYIFINDYCWFKLAQYFDGEAIKAIRGEDVLARKLGLKLSEIFPICFDVRNRSKFDSDCLHGTFELNPKWGLSRDETMSILVKEISIAAREKRQNEVLDKFKVYTEDFDKQHGTHLLDGARDNGFKK